MSVSRSDIDFNIIRYANCWEDADVLLRALNLQTGDKVLSIASAGDNSLSLLSQNPMSVTAVDVSLPQLHLTNLKKAAFATLSYTELLEFLGVRPSTSRLAAYEKVKMHLCEKASIYWDSYTEIVNTGVIHHGKFERYFKVFRKYLMPLVHNKRTIDELLAPKTPEEQKDFFHRKWNTRRWRLLMSLFFSRYVLGKYGRDPQFLKHVQLNTADHIRMKTEQHLQSEQCQGNYMLHYIFKGSFGSALPHYLREENYDVIRKNINNLHTIHADINDVIKENNDAYNFSNIFEYMSDTEFIHTVKKWTKHISDGAKLAYWNLMVSRSFSETDGEHFFLNRNFDNTPSNDMGFFYNRFLPEIKKS